MQKVFTWFGAIALFGALGMGCEVEPPFDPIGGNVAIEGSWTVDGAAPSLAACDAAGVTNVELRLYDRFGSEYFSDVQHVASCADGTLSTAARFRAGTYRVQWHALDARGSRVWRSGFDTITANDGDVIVSTTDIPPAAPAGFDPRGTEVSLSGEWQVNGDLPNATSCAATNIATVQVVFYDSDGTSPYTDADFTFSCADGSFNRPNSLAAGAYKSQWRALDGGGGIIAEDEILDLVVSPGDATLRTPNFVVELSPTLAVTLAWQEAADAFATCDEAIVEAFDYTLRDSAGVDVSTMIGIGCTESLEFSDIAPGTYSLDVAGYFTGGGQGWETTCDGLIVDASGRTEYICNIAAVDPRLDVNIAWQTDSGGHGTCDEATVDTFSYWFYDIPIGGTPINEMLNIPCTELISFEDLAPGEYRMEFDATRFDRGKLGGTCDMLVTEFGLEEYNCFVDLS